MTQTVGGWGDGERRRPSTRGGRHRLDRRSANHPTLVRPKVLAALVSAVIVAVTGMGWLVYRDASAGITRSEALEGEPPSIGSDQNILIMGLDSRRDQQGRPLPQDIYDALHAGDEDSGTYDVDVLIVLHLPAGDGPVIAISIPRDDYVDLPGCPTSDCQGKIKEAYSLAYESVTDSSGADNEQSSTSSADAQDIAAQEQLAREAGRKAQISAVRRLLRIPIDHFIEISLLGFFQIAGVVEPITVCLNEDTSDPYYSGADFHKGIQQINAAQAVGFVRQRRDVNDELFTDLDRTRRQQAFIASLVSALRHSGALSSPSKLRTLLGFAKQYFAVDAGFDLDGFIRYAAAFTDRRVVFYTLPVIDFRTTPYGEDINIIDESTIRSIVHDLLAPDSSSATPSTESTSTSAQAGANLQPTAQSMVLNVINASRQEGLAAALMRSLAPRQFTEGTASTADSASETSTIAYGPGAEAAAAALADELGLSATVSDAVAPNTVLLTVGTDFRSFEYLEKIAAASESATTSPTAPITTVPATGTGTQAPAPTNLTLMTAGDIPCVK
jgi:LCP family protein required for cell wall assembly